MKQNCRYCHYCTFDLKCTLKNKVMTLFSVKNTNSCKDFKFNKIDSLNEINSNYEPREKIEINKNQISLFEMEEI